jgi:rhamnosyltransferase
MSHREPDGPSVSIIIKTKNQRHFLERSLPRILSQTLRDFEAIVVDSGSTDGALDVVRRHQSEYGPGIIHLLEIPPGDFHHVKTLNLAIERARGQYIVSLSGDAVPATDIWLESLARHFDDPLVAGVYGRQLADRDAQFLERLRVGQRYGEECIVKTKGQDHIFSNANSMFRKSLVEEYRPDESLPACEDYDWAREMHERGYKIVYEPAAAVHHAHRISTLAYLKRILWFRYLRFKIDHLRRWRWLWRTLP